MGRKGAPEPLSLPDDSGSGNLGETYNPTNAPALVRSASSGNHERLSPASFPVANSATPTSSRSPKSPRSPLSRTNVSKKPQTPVHAHSPSEPQAETSSQFAGIPRPPYSVDDVNAHQFHHLRQDIGNRPKTSGGQHPSSFKQASQQRRGPEHSRSASRFWGFGKSSKSNQFRHVQANSSSEAMSRGSDYPGTSEKGSSRKNKESGMYHRELEVLPMSNMSRRFSLLLLVRLDSR